MTTLYTVHQSPQTTDAAPVRIKDGFTWLAFLLPPAWLAWHRLWWELAVGAIVLVVGSIVGVLIGAADLTGWIWLALALITGFEGPGWRRAALLRRGWREHPAPA